MISCFKVRVLPLVNTNSIHTCKHIILVAILPRWFGLDHFPSSFLLQVVGNLTNLRHSISSSIVALVIYLQQRNTWCVICFYFTCHLFQTTISRIMHEYMSYLCECSETVNVNSEINFQFSTFRGVRHPSSYSDFLWQRKMTV